ncbi:hypothetical protein ACHQM5_027362 [Ranunculus cassubicifolius]
MATQIATANFRSTKTRRWAIDLTDSSSLSIKDIPDPLGYSPISQDQDDSTVSRQKKDAEAVWKSQTIFGV